MKWYYNVCGDTMNKYPFQITDEILNKVAGETYLTVIGISKNNTIAIIITVLLCLSTVITEIAKCKTVFSTCKKHAEKYHQPLFDSFYKKELEKNKNELEIVEKMKTE